MIITQLKTKKTFFSLVILLILLVISGSSVYAEGLNLSFYQALEGKKVSIVDGNGGIIETVVIDAMGNANFKNSIAEGQKLEMNLDTPEDMDSINQRVVYGYELKTVVGLVITVAFLVFVATYLFMKQTMSKKYEYLMDYAYNERFDKVRE